MFGHSDDNQQQQQNQNDAATVQPTVAPATDMQGFTPPPTDPPTTDVASPVADPVTTAPEPVPTATLDVSADSALELPDSSGLPGGLTASEPSVDESAAPEPATTAPAPTDASMSTGTDDTPVALAGVPDDLINIKQEALQELSPLVEHLDQTPEERFRTTMMMIQATDDSTKIKDAYDAAQQIEDKKVRAQALLDVVNEINYFTQQQKQAE